MNNTNFQNAIDQTTKLLNLWLPMKVKYSKTIGFSVGIVHNGKIIYRGNFGYTDKSHTQPITDDTCYRIASISKLFTTTAIFQLIEQNKFSLTTKVSEILPWFNAKSSISNASLITIEDLLSHRAGIWRDGNTRQWTEDAWPSKDIFIKSFKEESLILKNKKNFKYSNFGYSVLGLVIEKITGISYEEYVGTHIFEKIGLMHTSSDYNETLANSQLLATGYGSDFPDQGREEFKHYPTKVYAPATGFVSNVPDLSNFISALMEGKILSKKSLRLITKAYSKTKKKEQYGLGSHIYKVRKKKIIGHTGGFPGFNSECSYNVETGFGVVVLSNTEGASVTGITEGIFNTLFYYLENNTAPDQKLIPYNGIYRNRSSDTILYAVGKKIKVFSPANTIPFSSTQWITPHKKGFIYESEGLFGVYGEPVTFEVKGDKVIEVSMGPDNSKKII